MNLIDGDIHQKFLHDDPFGSVKFSMQVLDLMIRIAKKNGIFICATLERRGRSARKPSSHGAPFTKKKTKFPKRTQWGLRRRYIRPNRIPRTTPIMSATQSLMSALRLKLGWMSSMRPPKAVAPINTGSKPNRPVLARGKERAAKAMRCTTLSLPSGAGGGASKGQSIATVRVRVTMTVIRMSRYLRIMRCYCPQI